MKAKFLIGLLCAISLGVQAQNMYWHQNGEVVAGGNGSGSGANQLSWTTYMAVDHSGNIYIADALNHRIMKWAPGAITGITVDSNLQAPLTGICVDNQGNLYATVHNKVLKWIQASGTPVLVAGSPLGTSGVEDSLLGGASGLYVDAQQNLYVADGGNARIQKYALGATNGITVAGGNGQGSAANQLAGPQSVYVDNSGNMYILDNENYRVQKWSPGATEGITVAGGNGSGTNNNQIEDPGSFFVNNSGYIFVTESANSKVTEWVTNATTNTVVIGADYTSPTQFSIPTSIYIDNNNNMYINDEGNYRILKFTDSNSTTITSKINQQIKINIFPNPASNIITISGRVDYKENKKIDIIITNLLGQIVYRDFVDFKNERIEKQIDLNDFKDGFYTVEMYISNKLTSTSFIVKK